ncbi:MAG: alpha/beta hydrolase [Opitutales bacterium]
MTIQFQQLHPVAQFLVAAVILYIVLCLLALLMARPMMFPAPSSSYDESFPTVTLRTPDDLAVSGIFLENPSAELTLLFSHGNGEDIGWAKEFLEELRDLGFSVFAYDYPGYGLSEGSPSEDGCYQSAEAAYRYLIDDRGIDPATIVLHGRSLGSGPSLELASKYPVGGVILESPFVSAFRVLTRIPLFPFDQFNNLEKIQKISCPSLIIHGERDEVVAFWHGQRLHEVAPEPKVFLPLAEASHNDVYSVGGTTYLNAILSFANSLTTPKEEAP